MNMQPPTDAKTRRNRSRKGYDDPLGRGVGLSKTGTSSLSATMNNRKSECHPNFSDVTLLCDPALSDQTECIRMLLVLLLKKNLSVRRSRSTTTMMPTSL
mmetsp:Transcript_1461/g.3162  ORF Transcript_1461/g.3162 Transcript_1461/m.3162 type:complete len:100 (-) Transcript_1461:103-402(-)